MTVVIAIITTVAARAPAWSWHLWAHMVVTGTVIAAVGLTCVWIACGRCPLRWRVLTAPLLAILLAAALHLLLTAANWYFNRGQLPGNAAGFWAIVLRDLSQAGPYWITTIAIAMTIVCGWLVLVRRAAWFDPFGDAPAQSLTKLERPRVLRARWAASIMFCLVAVFPLVLLYRLVTPTPIPDVKLAEPNGYDDFIAAGRMIGAASGTYLQNSRSLTDAALRAELAKHAAAFERVRAGLQKACWHPDANSAGMNDDAQAIINLMVALSARCELADRNGSVDETLAAYWDLLCFSFEGDRGYGANYSVAAQSEPHAVLGLWNCRTRLSSPQCIGLAADLWKIETSREPWHIRAERQRIFDENMGWEWHLQSILADWTGVDRYDWRHDEVLRRVAEMRMLIIELGIRAHQLESETTPKTLSELVPKYLPAVPDDPYSKGPITYRVSAEGYTLYSFGPDGDDDGGQPFSDPNGDLTSSDLFPSAPQSPASDSSKADGVNFDPAADTTNESKSEKAPTESKQ